VKVAARIPQEQIIMLHHHTVGLLAQYLVFKPL